VGRVGQPVGQPAPTDAPDAADADADAAAVRSRRGPARPWARRPP
jgi:hypothetical protein